MNRSCAIHPITLRSDQPLQGFARNRCTYGGKFSLTFLLSKLSLPLFLCMQYLVSSHSFLAATCGPCEVSGISPLIGSHRVTEVLFYRTSSTEHTQTGQVTRNQCHFVSATSNSCRDRNGSVVCIKQGAGFGSVSMRNSLFQIFLFFLTVVKVMNEEQRIGVCKTGLNQIYTMLRTAPQNWRNYVNLARSVIAHLDATTFMQQASRTAEQAWMVAGLQSLAFADAEGGGIPDVASWCSRQWLMIFQRDPQSIAALRGIGQSWLSRAQPVLTRIHRLDGSGSSSGGSSQRSAKSHSGNGGEEERQSAAANAEAERRAGTQDYVEARGFLQPATEYLQRAVAAATAQRALSGDLLATVS